MNQMVQYGSGRVRIDERVSSSASPAAVWALLVDTEGWPAWSPMQEARRERDGVEDREGVGAHRRFRTGRSVSHEEVVAFEPPAADGSAHFAYVLLDGLPLRGYRADVHLSARPGGGTDIAWVSTFDPKIPGTGAFWRFALGRFVRRVAIALARAAEAPPTAR